VFFISYDQDIIYLYIDKLIKIEDFEKYSDYMVAQRELYDSVVENLRGSESKKDLKKIVHCVYNEIMDILDEEEDPDDRYPSRWYD